MKVPDDDDERALTVEMRISSSATGIGCGNQTQGRGNAGLASWQVAFDQRRLKCQCTFPESGATGDLRPGPGAKSCPARGRPAGSPIDGWRSCPIKHERNEFGRGGPRPNKFGRLIREATKVAPAVAGVHHPRFFLAGSRMARPEEMSTLAELLEQEAGQDGHGDHGKAEDAAVPGIRSPSERILVNRDSGGEKYGDKSIGQIQVQGKRILPR